MKRFDKKLQTYQITSLAKPDVIDKLSVRTTRALKGAGRGGGGGGGQWGARSLT